MINNKLKLYVWEDVLTNYTSGMVSILAESLDEAKEIFLEKYSEERYVLDNFFGKPHKVITKPEAFYVYGGG